MARVLLTRKLPGDGLGSLAGHELVGPEDDDRALSHEELCAHAGQVDGIVCLLTDRIDAEVLEAGKGRLQIVANVAVGYDNIDVAAANRLGIRVCNTPGVLDETTADTAFMLILAAARRASEAEAELREGRWQGFRIAHQLGRDVHGARLGLVGYGRIARAVARRAEGFSMTVTHHSRRDTGEAGFVADLDAMLPEVDILSLHVPGGDETHHLIDARRLSLLPRHAVLVNTARGPVVDEAALAGALHRGELFAAGLDVYEREPTVHPDLLTAPRTVLLPHIGSATWSTREAMANLALTAIAQHFDGQTPPNVVPPSSSTAE